MATIFIIIYPNYLYIFTSYLQIIYKNYLHMYKDYLQIYKFSYLQYVQVEAPGRLIYFLQFCLRN